MTVSPDPRLVAILRDGAPPRSDPMFRVRVLQRLERKRFRRRLYALGVLACGATGTALAIFGAEAEVTGVVLFCAAAAVSIFAHAPVVGYFWRRFTAHGVARRAS
jgi:hypothetical protein